MPLMGDQNFNDLFSLGCHLFLLAFHFLHVSIVTIPLSSADLYALAMICTKLSCFKWLLFQTVGAGNLSGCFPSAKSISSISLCTRLQGHQSWQPVKNTSENDSSELNRQGGQMQWYCPKGETLSLQGFWFGNLCEGLCFFNIPGYIYPGLFSFS